MSEAARLARLLDEANHDPWESLASALRSATGQVPPRVAWLVQHVAETKREYWRLIRGVTDVQPAPLDADLTDLTAWEVSATARLSPHALTACVTHAGRSLTVAELIRLNARHTVWHAGQIAALATQRFA